MRSFCHDAFVASAHQPQFLYLYAVVGLEEGAVVAVGHLHGMYKLGSHADGVEVVGEGIVHIGDLLSEQRHHSIGLLDSAEGLYAVLAANSNRGNGSGEENVVA